MSAASCRFSCAISAVTRFVSFGTEVFRSLEIGLTDLEETRMSLSAFSMGSACDVFIQARIPRKTVENSREPRNFIRAKCANLMPQLVQRMLGLVLKNGFDVLHNFRGEFVQDFRRFQGFFELLCFGSAQNDRTHVRVF